MNFFYHVYFAMATIFLVSGAILWKNLILYQKTKRVVNTLIEINSAIGKVHEQSTYIAQATEQQTQAAQDINSSLVAITDLSDRTSVHAQELAVEATQLSGVSSDLKDLVGQFKI